MLRWIEAAARLRRSGFSRPRRSGRQPLALPRPRRGRGTGGGRGRGCRERCAWADAGACRPGAGQVDPRPWGGPRADRRGDEHRRARPTEGGAGRPHAAQGAGRARRGDPHQPADRHRARPRPGAGRSDATGGPGGAPIAMERSTANSPRSAEARRGQSDGRRGRRAQREAPQWPPLPTVERRTSRSLLRRGSASRGPQARGAERSGAVPRRPSTSCASPPTGGDGRGGHKKRAPRPKPGRPRLTCVNPLQVLS